MTADAGHGQFVAMPILFFLAAASVDACALAVQNDPPAAMTVCVEKPLKPGNNYLWDVPLSPACRETLRLGRATARAADRRAAVQQFEDRLHDCRNPPRPPEAPTQRLWN